MAVSSDHPPSSSFKPKSTSKAPDTSVQHTTEPTSTEFSVTVVPSGVTSTVTTHPTSTLSEPVSSTITDSNGSQVVTRPAIVTLWSTSTNINGTISTATAVVANPLDDLSPPSGVLHNTGAVAGIFSAVGVVFTCLVVCLAIYLRRRRRDRQHEKWLAGMKAQRPNSFNEDAFHDENLPPVIHSVYTNDEDGPWDQKGLLAPEGISHHSHPDFVQTNTSIIPILPNGTFGRSEKQLLQSTDESRILLNKARHSWAPSTPSLYPASLSPEDERASNILAIVPFSQSVITSPPRPPRSHLRDRGTKVLRSGLPTPPESEYSNPTLSLVSEPHSGHVLDKKSLDAQFRLSTP